MDALILTWITDVFFIFTLHILYVRILEIKFSNKWFLVTGWAVCFVLWNVSSYVFADLTIAKAICGVLVNLAVLCICYRGNSRQKFMLLFMVVALGIISEIMVAFLFKIAGIDLMKEGLKQNNYYYLGNFVSKIIWFLFVRILSVISKDREQFKMGIAEWCEVFLVPVGTTFILMNMACNKEYNMGSSDIFIIGILLTFNISSYFIYEKIQEHGKNTMEQELLRQQNEYYKKSFEDTKMQWAQLRKTRHDLKNNYVLGYSYLENGQYEMLKEQYDIILDQLRNPSNVINTGCIGIDSIVNYKTEMARENGILISGDALMGGTVSVNNFDLNVLLGNLFDNAIEAANKLPEGERKIQFVIRSDKTALYFEIRNTHANHIERSPDGNYETSKPDKVNHGFGIKTVRDIVKRYDGKIDIAGTEKSFYVKVMMYMQQHNVS